MFNDPIGKDQVKALGSEGQALGHTKHLVIDSVIFLDCPVRIYSDYRCNTTAEINRPWLSRTGSQIQKPHVRAKVLPDESSKLRGAIHPSYLAVVKMFLPSLHLLFHSEQVLIPRPLVHQLCGPGPETSGFGFSLDRPCKQSSYSLMLIWY